MDIETLLTRGVAEVLVEDHLVERLRTTKRPLRIKYGVDPSRPDIHLGHYVCFRKLRQFQDLGHEVVVIIGDWTAQIGDPSGRSGGRTMLTAEEVRANAKTYLDQFFKVVDLDRAEVVWQSKWFADFKLADVIQLASKYTVAQMLAREDFHNRFEAGNPISIVEFLYPLLQGYDSIAIESDVELGGSDQKFNLLVGRELQREVGQEPQDLMIVPLLVGLDGSQKMSKSLGNYVAVNDLPEDMYGKVMSIPDSLITEYFWLVTDVPKAEIEGFELALKDNTVNPRDLKMRLAREIVAEFHDAAAAATAEEEFKRIFQRHEEPSDMPKHELTDGLTIIQLMSVTGTASSNAEAKRLVDQGGVKLDGKRITDNLFYVTVPEPDHPVVLQVGKRKYVVITAPSGHH
jgi:tyrosyl-tRNA synthetase